MLQPHQLQQLPMREIAQVAQHGSPMLIAAVGRAFGLGEAERRALAGSGGGALPWWLFAVVGIGVGLVVGARVQRKYPALLPEIVRGK